MDKKPHGLRHVVQSWSRDTHALTPNDGSVCFHAPVAIYRRRRGNTRHLNGSRLVVMIVSPFTYYTTIPAVSQSVQFSVRVCSVCWCSSALSRTKNDCSERLSCSLGAGVLSLWVRSVCAVMELLAQCWFPVTIVVCVNACRRGSNWHFSATKLALESGDQEARRWRAA